MADRTNKVILSLAGGWATDRGPSYTGAPQGTALPIPFLLSADNIVYELDGAPHKVGGASRLNSTQLTESGSGVAFHGVYDYWTQGTGGTETQKRVAYAGTQILKEDVDGTWDVLTTGQENNKEPCFETFTDLCILATTSTVDVPRTWNGTDASTSVLGGSPPNFAFHVKHKNRLWAAGNAALPSRLYYSNSLAPADWSGGGSIDIDPDDGDRIVGLISHKNELFVFKGPNRLSIHRITGSAPSDFARVPFITGAGGINHNSIFRIGDDIVFASPRGLHSLAATAAYGDYIEAFLSHPILSYYQDSLNASVLPGCWGVNYQARGVALWNFAKSGGTTRNVVLLYDYRFQPGWWASWGVESSYVNCHSLAILQTSARKHRLFAGTADGYVYQLDIAQRAINSTGAYTAHAHTPFLNFGSSAVLKNAERIFISLAPKGDYDLTFGLTRDNASEESFAIDQGGGGFVLDTGELDLDTGALGGSQFKTRTQDLTGVFREAQFHFSQTASAQDMEPHFAEFHFTPAGVSGEDL